MPRHPKEENYIQVLKPKTPRPCNDWLDLIFYRDDQKCVLCGKPATAIHHIKPCLEARVQKKGFSVHHPFNLVSLCNDCHAHIHRYDHEYQLYDMIVSAEIGFKIRDSSYDDFMHREAIRAHKIIKNSTKQTPLFRPDYYYDANSGLYIVYDSTIGTRRVMSKFRSLEQTDEYINNLSKAKAKIPDWVKHLIKL